MKRIAVFVALATLTGCKSTSFSNNNEQAVIDDSASVAAPKPVLASPSQITQALLGQPEADLPVFDAESYDDLWLRVRDQLQIPVPNNRAVAEQRNWYVANQAYINRVVDRAGPFLYYIVNEIEKRNMPLELALLPVVESAFDPFGFSVKTASGIWQFMPATGTQYGLTQNWWVDQRRDIVLSTKAALDYLTVLHRTLGEDWLNAIAAYNSGEGRVLAAINKNKQRKLPIDFWSLDLPAETVSYVPKLLAIADVLKNAEQYNIVFNPLSNSPMVEVVSVGQQIDLALAAQMAQMDLNDLFRLNPGFNRLATNPKGPHQLLMPVDSAENFKTALANSDSKDLMRWERYQVKKGDSLAKIASRYNVSVKSLRTFNNLQNNIVTIGDNVLVPLSDMSLDDIDIAPDLQKRLARSSLYKSYYVVSNGDTLWDIANKHKVTIQQLAKWNSLNVQSPLQIGQKLVVMQGAVKAKEPVLYTVRAGDSLSKIAQKYKVTVAQLGKWNNINPSKHLLRPGQSLKVELQ